MSTKGLGAKTTAFMEGIFTDTGKAIQEAAAANIVISNNQPDGIPLKSSYEGHEGVEQFVADLKEHIDLGPIQYSDLYVDGNTVLGLGEETSAVKATGKTYVMPFVHTFRYDDNEKIVELRIFNNTHRLAVAFGK